MSPVIDAPRAPVGIATPIAQKPLRRDGLGYVYEPIGWSVRFRIDYLSHRGDDLTGEVIVESLLPDGPPHLHQGRLNLDSTAGKRDLAKYLVSVSRQVPWRELVEQLCVSVLRAQRQGEPFLVAGRLPVQPLARPVVDRLIPDLKPSALYGAGGTGKGYIATGIAVAVTAGVPFAGLIVQQGSVLYLDWADDIEELDLRVKEVSTGMGLSEIPEIHRAVSSLLVDPVAQPNSLSMEPRVAIIEQ